MQETKFKFEPVWTGLLGLLAIYLLYQFTLFIFQPNFKIDILFVFGLLCFLAVPCLVFLPMAIKMIIGVPAILLTHDQLVDNVSGVLIDWANVEDIRITGTRKPFLSITLKDRDRFFSTIANPLKRVLLKLLYATVAGDASINLAFVKGDNETIAGLSRVYWQNFYGVD
jgi:hypothetical protein